MLLGSNLCLHKASEGRGLVILSSNRYSDKSDILRVYLFGDLVSPYPPEQPLKHCCCLPLHCCSSRLTRSVSECHQQLLNHAPKGAGLIYCKQQATCMRVIYMCYLVCYYLDQLNTLQKMSATQKSKFGSCKLSSAHFDWCNNDGLFFTASR